MVSQKSAWKNTKYKCHLCGYSTMNKSVFDRHLRDAHRYKDKKE